MMPQQSEKTSARLVIPVSDDLVVGVISRVPQFHQFDLPER
jgi:hypothetical protein